MSVNFNTLTLVDDGIILGLKNNQQKQISFLELDKVYMKVHKLKPMYELVFILFPFLFILLAVQYVMLEKVMFVALITVVPLYVKTFRWKKYGLTMCLKDGTVFRKNVSLRLKVENITMINTVKKAWMKHNILANQLNDAEPMEFRHPKAS